MMKYRSDIDGLRAVAILPVVLYHLDVTRLSGGFVGVDIFFVISGFLITGLIHRDIVEGSYSVTEFYSRRARRIFPALFVMMALTSLAVAVLFLPSEVEEFRRIVLSTILFSSNIYFYVTQDYFVGNSDVNLLLHTWSLAVEEQFYIVFPFILILIAKFAPRATVPIVAGLLAASFGVSVYLVTWDKQAAFYLLQSRAWELLLGSLIALGAIPHTRSRALTEAGGLAGIALIGWSVLYTAPSPFPGAAAAPACLGAALVIWSGLGRRTFVAAGLGLAPVRFIGLISYSLYLWHWPVIMIARFLDPEPFTFKRKLVLLAVSVVLAIASWLIVERPLRTMGARLGRTATLTAAGAAIAALLAGAWGLVSISELAWRPDGLSRRVMDVANAELAAPLKAGPCFLTSKWDSFHYFSAEKCLRRDDKRPNYLVVGDSHAAHLVSGLRAGYPGINFMMATSSGCKPVLPFVGAARCRELFAHILENYLPSQRVDAVILSAEWGQSDAPSVRKTLDAFARHADKVILFGPSVEFGQPLPRVAALERLTNDKGAVVRGILPGTMEADRAFKAELAGSPYGYVSMFDLECPQGTCTLLDREGLPIYFDRDHLTEKGSADLMDHVLPGVP